MPFFRLLVVAACTTALAAGSAQAVSPDFYGIRMNSENHARDLTPDELSLFPVRRGFDKNIYAYAHLDRTFNHTRSVTFNVFNNTDNDLFTEKSFREYYIVLRNGERYRLDEPGMTFGVERIDARGSATLRADFGRLNVTKEEIEMIVCSFDMGKVKIVLLPIAQEPPPPLPKEEAAKLTAPKDERGPAPVYPADKLEPRAKRGPDGPAVRAPGGGGRFPLMDWPIFSWMKGTSAELPKPKPVPEKKEEAAPKTNFSPKTPAGPAPVSIEPIPGKPAEKKPPRGLLGSFFGMFEPKPKGASSAESGTLRPRRATTGGTSDEREFFWKPRDLEPIPSIDDYQAGRSKPKAAKKEKKSAAKEAFSEKRSQEPAPKPFYMKRALSDAKVPHDEPVTAVSAPESKKKAPVLKPEKKLRPVGPRRDAQIVQVNRQMGFIIVNAGSADGLRENMVLNVYRRGKVVAKAVVRKLNEDAAAALLMKEWGREDVRVGDPVSLY